MRYIIIPILILLYCIWTYKAFKAYFKYGFVSASFDDESDAAMWWTFVHLLIILGIGGEKLLIFTIENW